MVRTVALEINVIDVRKIGTYEVIIIKIVNKEEAIRGVVRVKVVVNIKRTLVVTLN